MTLYKTAEAAMAQLTAVLGQLPAATGRVAAGASASEVDDDTAGRELTALVDALTTGMAENKPRIAKLNKTAAETDPDRRQFGPAMLAKVALLLTAWDELVAAAATPLEQATSVLDGHKSRRAALSARRTAESAAVAAEAARIKAAADAAADAEATALAEAATRQAADAAAVVAAERAEKAAAVENERRAKATKAAAAAAAVTAAAAADKKQKDEAAAAAAATKAAAAEADRAAVAARVIAARAATAAAATAAAPLPVASAPPSPVPPPPVAPTSATVPAPSPSPPPGHVHHITRGATQLRELMSRAASRDAIVVVDWTAAWCGPCKMIAPVLESLAAAHPTTLFASIDQTASSENAVVTAQAAIAAFPTFHFYRGLRRVAEFSGADRRRLERTLAECLTQSQTQSLTGHLPAAAATTGAFAAPGAFTSRVVAAFRALRSECAYVDFVAATRLILTYVSDAMAASPGAARLIPAANATFVSRVASRPGGVDTMRALGFTLEATATGLGGYVLRTIDPELSLVRWYLEDALRAIDAAGGTAEAAETAPVPPAIAPPPPPPPPPAGEDEAEEAMLQEALRRSLE